MKLIKDNSFQTIQIKRNVTGHTGEDGNWVPGGEYLVATVEADIQPRTGRERATEVQTEYESDYVMFVDVNDIIFEVGFNEIKQGDIAEDEAGKKYDVVFPGNWRSHYEIDLKSE